MSFFFFCLSQWQCSYNTNFRHLHNFKVGELEKLQGVQNFFAVCIIYGPDLSQSTEHISFTTTAVWLVEHVGKQASLRHSMAYHEAPEHSRADQTNADRLCWGEKKQIILCCTSGSECDYYLLGTSYIMFLCMDFQTFFPFLLK